MKQLIRTMKKNRLMSTVLALTLTLALLLSTVAGLPIFAADGEIDSAIIWDGTENTESATEGTGHEGDPYIIKTAKQFYHYMKWGYSTGRKIYLKLDTDIYLNAPGTFDPATGEVLGDKVNTWSAKEFQGEIDGNGHTIYGLYTNENPASYGNTSTYYGLLSQPVNGTSITIKNLGIDDVYINANGSAAAFVAYTTSSIGRVYITNSYVGKNVTIKATYTGAFIARGTISASDYLEVTRCYSLATLEGNGKGASLIGAVSGGYYRIVENYATHDIFVNSGGNIARNYSTTQATTSYYVTNVADADIKGAGALAKMPDLNTSGDFFVETDSYPILSVFVPKSDDSETPGGDGSGGGDSIIDPSIIWDGSANTESAKEGDGTEGNPYIIKNAKQFYHYMYWGYSVANDLYLKLDTDIYLNAPGTFDPATGEVLGDKVNTWSAKKFRGTIDGNGHTIYGLYTNENPTEYSSESSYYGLFSQPVSGRSITIKNLGIDDVYINAKGVAAAFVAFSNNATGRVKFENSYVGENVTIIARSAGAFISWGGFTKPASGDNYIVIDSCYSLATLEAHGKYASLVGSIWSGWYTISKCYATHDIASAGTSNCYSTTQGTAGSTSVALVADADIKGANALSAMPNLGAAFVVTKTYPALSIFPYEAPGDSGETPDPEPEPEETIIISTASELIEVMSTGGEGKSYKLTADIYLNDISNINWTDGTVIDETKLNTWTPKTFNGTIDGDGHVIYGLYINENPTEYTKEYVGFGLISKVDTSVTIKNLGIDYIYINANGVAAAFVGISGNGYGGYLAMSNCYVGQNAKIIARAAGAMVAWGQSNQSVTPKYLEIDTCYSLATLEAHGKSARFIGSHWGGHWNITNCYATHDIAKEGTVSSSYSTTTAVDSTPTHIVKVNDADIQGTKALDNMPALSDAFVETDSYPQLSIFVVQPVKENGAHTYGTNLRFMMKYTGQKSDPNTIVIDDKTYTIVERGFLIKGENVISDLRLDSTEKGVFKVSKTDLSDNWSFDEETSTTVYSLNISGFKKQDTYKMSARGYITLSDGTTHYTNMLTTCVNEVPNQNLIDNKEYIPNTVTLTLYDADSYGVTWQTEKMPEKAVVQVSKGSSFDEENYTEFEASTSAEQSYDINNALYTYYVSKAVITGLKPNTTYTYRCYDALVGVPGEEFTFTTRDRSVSSFKFVHVSDSQTNASSSSSPNGAGTGVYYANTMKGVELNGFDADFILHSGDIVEWSKYESYWTSMIGDNAKYFAEIPVMAIAGNHEATYRNGDRELYKHFNYKIHEQDVSKGFSYSFDYGNTKFIMLDTNNLTSDRVLSDDVYTWLEETLENNQQKWTIVTMHHPMYSVGKYGSDTSLNATSLALRAQLSNLFAENGVDLVIQGHDHTLSKTYPIGMNGAINNNLTYETINGTDYCTNANGVVYVMHGASGNQTRWPYDTVETQYYEEYSNSETSTWAEFEITENLLTVKVYSYNSGTPKLLMNYGIKK